MIPVDDEPVEMNGTNSVTIGELRYLAERASYRMSVHALNRLAEILLGKEKAKEDWKFDELYEAAANAKLAESDLAKAGGLK